MRTDISIPTAVNQITSEWLSSAFEESGTAPFPASVDSIEVFPEGLSATGTLARVFLSYSGANQGPATLIAKLPDPAKANKATAATYEREITFYSELGDDVGVRVPKMYFGASAGNSAIMLLEDLSPAVPGDSTTGCSFDEAVAAVKGLAAIHARWWNSYEVLDGDWLWGKSFNASPDESAADIDKGWALAPADYRTNLSTDVAAVCDAGGWFADVVRHRSTGPHVLSHPDYRLDNLFFGSGADGVELMVIDWGRVASQRPGFGLAFFLSDSGLSTEEIRQCIDLYWQELVYRNAIDFGADDCNFEFRLGCLELLGQRLWQMSVGASVGADERIQLMRRRGWYRVASMVEYFGAFSAIGR